MANQFEPYITNKAPLVFNQWESSEQTCREPFIDPQEILRLECEQLKEAARTAGYQAGLQQAEHEILQIKNEFSTALQGLLQPSQLLDEALIQELIKTTLWLCQSCIGVELSHHPHKLQVLFNIIKDELPTLKGNKILTLHPLDLEWARTQVAEGVLEEIQNMLAADETLARGEFCLRSDQSVLDGRIFTRLSSLFADYVNKTDWLPVPEMEQE